MVVIGKIIPFGAKNKTEDCPARLNEFKLYSDNFFAKFN